MFFIESIAGSLERAVPMPYDQRHLPDVPYLHNVLLLIIFQN